MSNGKELTPREIETQDAVDGAILDLVTSLAPEGSEIEWDEEWGGEIRDIIKDVIVDKLHLMTEMEFYPYIEREEEPAANTVSEAEELSDAEVELIASGYEWTCPSCEFLNKPIEVKETVKCSQCGKSYKVADYEHAIDK